MAVAIFIGRLLFEHSAPTKNVSALTELAIAISKFCQSLRHILLHGMSLKKVE